MTLTRMKEQNTLASLWMKIVMMSTFRITRASTQMKTLARSTNALRQELTLSSMTCAEGCIRSWREES
jgi:hypothetical protein